MKMHRIILFSVFLAIAAVGAGCGSSTDTAANTSNQTPTAPASAPVAGNPASADNPASAGAEPSKGAVPAPENSEFTLTLSDVGKETRTFKNHPVLEKVEKTVTPDGESIKVYLKSGKVIDIEPDKIGSLKTESSVNILAAAGIKYVPPTPGTVGDSDAPQDNPRPVKNREN